jgi:hypothetical protein
MEQVVPKQIMEIAESWDHDWDRVYEPEPTPALFHQDDFSFVRGIRGPFGSGKTVACFWEIVMRGMKQKRFGRLRKNRWAVIRNSYPELKTTSLKTWQEWFPEHICPVNMSPPMTAHLTTPLADGSVLDLELIFVSLDKPKDVRKVLSLDLTGAFVNEAREIYNKSIIDAISARTGRYPPEFMGGPTWSGVIMDTNSPDDEHWWYEMAEEVKPSNWRFFDQPPALLRLEDGSYVPNPKAENVKHHTLGFEYWLRMIPGKDPEWINVYIMNQYGTVEEGKPVYIDCYHDHRHAAKESLPIYKGLPLYLGFDGGLTPACVAGQVSPAGRMHVLREWVCERGGIREFVNEAVKPALLREFSGMEFLSFADPSMSKGSEIDETTPLGELRELGLPTEPAYSNDPTIRRQAVISWLTQSMADGSPKFLVDPSCRMVRRGMAGRFQYRRVQIVGAEMYQEKVFKNAYSHPCEAHQYMVMGIDRGTVRPKRKTFNYRTRKRRSFYR